MNRSRLRSSGMAKRFLRRFIGRYSAVFAAGSWMVPPLARMASRAPLVMRSATTLTLVVSSPLASTKGAREAILAKGRIPGARREDSRVTADRESPQEPLCHPELREPLLFTLDPPGDLSPAVVLTLRGQRREPGGRASSRRRWGYSDADRSLLRRRVQEVLRFALGIAPYITASMVFQLMGAVVPLPGQPPEEGRRGRSEQSISGPAT